MTCMTISLFSLYFSHILFIIITHLNIMRKQYYIPVTNVGSERGLK